MRRVTLLVNPAAGSARRLAKAMPAIQSVLAAHAIEATFLDVPATSLAGRDALLHDGPDALAIACGGDGTVHSVLQAVAETGHALGVLPLGTANALARNLGLSLDPAAALEQLLTGTVRTLPLGRAELGVSTGRQVRWFLAMAGAGPDGALVREMAAGAKRRLGRGLYYAEAARLFATRGFAPFTVTYRQTGSAAHVHQTACGVLASRIPDLGGFFTGLTPLASLEDPHLHVQLLLPPAHLSFAAWMTLRTRSPWLQTVDVDELLCEPLAGDPDVAPVHTQLDAEAAGELPMRLSIVPNALRLLVPDKTT